MAWTACCRRCACARRPTPPRRLERAGQPSLRHRRIGTVAGRAWLRRVLAGAFVAVATAAAAADFESGYAAYQRGDFAGAIAQWQPLAAQGHALAQYNLGLMYAEGRGVVEARGEAMRWLRAAAEQGVAEAQYNLAGLHLAGAEPDYTAGRHWLGRAAEAGLDRAQHTLAKLYEYGLGGPSDDAKAYHYFSLAAAQGHPGAMYNLGKAIRDGRGAEASEAKSLEWFRHAAERGHAKAQAKLGQRYAQGRGVPKDHLEAFVWTSLAARQGLESATVRLETLRLHLSDDARRDAEARIAAFRPKAGPP